MPGRARTSDRCAFWLGLQLLLRGEVARSSGWLARASRLLDDNRLDCVLTAGDVGAARSAAEELGKMAEYVGLRCCARRRRTRSGPCCSARAPGRKRWASCAVRGRRGRNSAPPTRPPAPGPSWAWPAGSSGTTSRRRWSSTPPGGCSSTWARARPGPRRGALAEADQRGGGLTAREAQVLGLVAVGKTNRAIAADVRRQENDSGPAPREWQCLPSPQPQADTCRVVSQPPPICPDVPTRGQLCCRSRRRSTLDNIQLFGCMFGR